MTIKHIYATFAAAMNKAESNKASLWKMFAVFADIGAFTIGGGYAMVPIIRDAVTKRGWITEEEFPDILALAQTAPGLLAVNISIFAGYRIRKFPGALVATLGSCLPPFLIILAIAMFFTGFKDNPVVEQIFKGIRPVVVALIAVPMVKMAQKSNKSWWAWILTIVAMLLVAVLRVSPIYILLVTIVIALAVSLWLEKKGRNGNV